MLGEGDYRLHGANSLLGDLHQAPESRTRGLQILRYRVRVFDQNYVTNKYNTQHPFPSPRSRVCLYIPSHFRGDVAEDTVAGRAAVWEMHLVERRKAVNLEGERGGYPDAGLIGHRSGRQFEPISPHASGFNFRAPWSLYKCDCGVMCMGSQGQERPPDTPGVSDSRPGTFLTLRARVTVHVSRLGRPAKQHTWVHTGTWKGSLQGFVSTS